MNRPSTRARDYVILALFLGLLITTLVAIFGSATRANATGDHGRGDKVFVCHANQGNGYSLLYEPLNSAHFDEAGQPHSHGGHGTDVWPTDGQCPGDEPEPSPSPSPTDEPTNGPVDPCQPGDPAPGADCDDDFVLPHEPYTNKRCNFETGYMELQLNVWSDEGAGGYVPVRNWTVKDSRCVRDIGDPKAESWHPKRKQQDVPLTINAGL